MKKGSSCLCQQLKIWPIGDGFNRGEQITYVHLIKVDSFSGLNAPKLHKAYAGIGTYGAEAKSTYNFSNTTLTNQIGLQEDWNLLKMPGGVVKLDIRGQIYNAIKFKGY